MKIEVNEAYLQPPSSTGEWITVIEKDFEEQRNMPDVFGALDGTHIRICYFTTTRDFLALHWFQFTMPIMVLLWLTLASMEVITTVEF